MIAPPLNDRDCLAKLTARAARAIQRADLVDLAKRFPSLGGLVGWIRELPQRDDKGAPGDGPTVACDVPQRARVGASDPNCVERALLYLALAENIDPRPVRNLATIDTPLGRHTLVVEAGEPVVLDPKQTRNALGAGLWQDVLGQCATRNGWGVSLDHRELLDWVSKIAGQSAQHGDEEDRERVARAQTHLGQLIVGASAGSVRQAPGAKEDVGHALDLAAKVAPMFGPPGMLGVQVARTALGKLGLVP